MTTDDFVWCDVRWTDPDPRIMGKHWCYLHDPGHVDHVCCCGQVQPA